MEEKGGSLTCRHGFRLVWTVVVGIVVGLLGLGVALLLGVKSSHQNPTKTFSEPWHCRAKK